MEQNLDRAEAIIDAYGCDQSNLIAIMQETQANPDPFMTACGTLWV